MRTCTTCNGTNGGHYKTCPMHPDSISTEDQAMKMTPEQEAECRAAWGKRSWPIAFIDWRAGFAAGLAAREREIDLDQPEFTTLMRFYFVDDLAALVRAQEQHIQRLQSKLPTPRDEFPPSPRIG